MYARFIAYLAFVGLVWLSGTYHLTRPVVADAAPTVVNGPLRIYADRAIEAANPAISKTRRYVLAHMIGNIGDEVFTNREQAEYWVALVGAESGFMPNARSPTGAVGLGQLIVRYRGDHGKGCGLTDATEGDVLDDYTNLLLSACYFRSLLEMHNGVIPLAIVSFNQGPNSKDTKDADKGRAPSMEPAGHVTRITINKAKLDSKKDNK